MIINNPVIVDNAAVGLLVDEGIGEIVDFFLEVGFLLLLVALGLGSLGMCWRLGMLFFDGLLLGGGFGL